ncbi:hypothetical protein [Streptomyces sp. NPDC058657]|uniref:hypothetical protein n=1 Tax=unclassified Streptomyces TaxID=2593676 RepID=UPI00366734DC
MRVLETVFPALKVHKRIQGKVHWEAIAQGLGTPLPPDFIELSEWYPSFILADFLAIHLPGPGEEAGFVAGCRDDREDLEDLRDAGMSHGYVPYPEPGGLIAWGGSQEGDVFYWKTSESGPSSWTIVVSGRNDDWCEFQGTLTEYLAGLISGKVSPDGLPPNFPGHNPLVEIS